MQVDSYQVPGHPSGIEMRTQLNQIVQAILTQSSGPTEPVETYPGMIWADTTTGIIKQRTQDDTAWTELYPVNKSPGVPAGTIIMWWGDIALIPSGWVLCDGLNGTPDMRNRFPIGAGSTYAQGAAGGRTSVTLTTSEMPYHAHGYADPGHNHVFSDPGHAHSISDAGHGHGWAGGYTQVYAYAGGGSGLSGGNTVNTGTSMLGNGTGIGIYAVGTGCWNNASGTGLGFYAEGGGAAFDIHPPYIGMYFLMKL